MHGAHAEGFTGNLWIAGAIVAFCIVLSAFFSGSETALTAASRARMHALASSGDRRASLVNRLLKNRDRLIGAILLGNTIASIGSWRCSPPFSKRSSGSRASSMRPA